MPADAIAIFDLKQDGSTRPAKKQKVTQKRPEHIPRELFELYGERAPPIVVQEAQRLKPKPKIPYPAAQWEISAFTNPARKDGLVLKHWRKKPARAAAFGPATPADVESISVEKPGIETTRTQQPQKSGNVETDYPFAKYNIKVATPKYSDEEYQQHLQDPHWSKEETDYLMELALEYDLRWIVISDRYEFVRETLPVGTTGGLNGGDGASSINEKNGSADQDVTMSNSDNSRLPDSSTMSNPDPHLQQVRDVLIVQNPPPRTMEAMKSRYYTVAAKIMALRTPLSNMSSSEFELHEKMTQFNPNTELQRKDIASKLLSRDPAEIQEEELLLSELKRIVQNEDKLIQERKELYERLEAPPSSGNIAMYQSSQGLQQLMQQLIVADRNKKRRSLTGPKESTSSPATTVQTGDSRHPATSADRDQRGSQPGSATTKSRPASGLGPNIKRLSRAEEVRFGIQHHERITSGVTFRTMRIDKLVTGKSSAQSQKLAAALTELGIPTKLLMPTAKVCAEFEKLIASIQVLLDVRKISEKLEGEVRVLKQMKEDQSGDGKADKSDTAQHEGQNEEGESKLDEGDTKMSGMDVEEEKDEDEDEKDDTSLVEPEEGAEDDENEKKSDDEEDAEAEIDEEEEEDDDDGGEGGEGGTQDLDVEEEDAANSGPEDDASEDDGAEDDRPSDEEEQNDSEGEDTKSRTSVAVSTRSSRVRTKRSASLMSSTSRQSTKRQKK